jgi:YD repeat-containing protein
MRSAGANQDGKIGTVTRAPKRTPSPRTWLLVLAFFACMLAHADSGAHPPLGPATPAGLAPSCPTLDASSPLPPDLRAAPTPAAGAVAGSFAVSPTGEATYTIPIAVPPGRAGVEPRLAVVYDSVAGQGILGAGFALQGLSAVVRCPQSLAQDGRIRPVRYDAEDRLCLDGARLVQVGGSLDFDGSGTREYRTFPDRFVKVVAHYPPSAAWDPARGPRSFEVFTKGGRILEYGTTDDSRPRAKHEVVAAWWVAVERDRRGNAIAYRYGNDLDPTGSWVAEHYPMRIDYTSGPGLPATRSVRFEYMGSHLHPTYFRAGMKLSHEKLLARIRTFGPREALVRTYDFTYTTGAGTERTLIDSVHECAADGTCKPPTRFGWSSHPSQGFLRMETGVPAPLEPQTAGMPVGSRASWTLADVTGDGMPDIVVSSLRSLAGGGWEDAWRVARNVLGPERYAPAETWHDVHPDAYALEAANGAPAPGWGAPFDYDMDGRKDFLLDPKRTLAPTWQVLHARADHAFEILDTGIPRPPFDLTDDITDSALLADVDGDGAADLIQCVNPSYAAAADGDDSQARWTVHLGTPTVPGFDPTPIPIPALDGRGCWLASLTGWSAIKVADLDGDGKAELLVPPPGAFSDIGGSEDDLQALRAQCGAVCTYTALSYEGGGAWSSADTKLPTPGDVVQRSNGVPTAVFADVNGDGLPDAVVNGFPDGRPRLFINTGDGFDEGRPALSGPLPPYNDTDGGEGTFLSMAQVLDYDGDGSADLLVPLLWHCADPTQPIACWVVLRASHEGPGPFTAIDTGIPLDPGSGFDGTGSPVRRIEVADVDDDGRQDLVVPEGEHFSVYLNDGPQDLLLSVTDGRNPLDPEDAGFLPTVSITYDAMIDRAETRGLAKGSAAYDDQVYLARSDPADGCAYPRVCAVGFRRVVSKVAFNDGANAARTFRYQYRDGRADLQGRGFLGFGARVVFDVDGGGGTAEFYDNATYDPTFRTYPFAGQVARAWAWQPAEAEQPSPTQVELTFAEVERRVIGDGFQGNYFTLPVSAEVTREEGDFQQGDASDLFAWVREKERHPATVLGRSYHVVSSWDAYGNVLAENDTIEGADASTATTRSFLTDPASWQIAFVQQETTCSAGLGETQCRSGSYVPDAFGEVVAAQLGDPADAETQLRITFARDAYGNVVATTADDAFGHHRAACTSYDADATFPFAHRDGALHLSFSAFDPGLGVPTSAVDPNGLVTRWQHDGFGRIVVEHRPDGTTTRTTLDRDKHGGTDGRAWQLVVGTESDGGGRRTTHYDALGRIVLASTKGPDVTACDDWVCSPHPWYTQAWHYDHLGRLDRVSLPQLGEDPAGKTLYDRYDHDAAGRVTRHTTPWGAVITYAYAELQKATTDWTGTTVMRADALGRVVETTDKLGGTTGYAYGPFGALWTVTGPDGAVTRYERDAYGRVRHAVDPDRGETFTDYDGFDEATSSTDARGWTYAFAYDPIGRLVQRVDHDGTTTWTYDTAPHGVGRVASVTSPSGNVKSYGYDPLSRPASVSLTIEGETFTSSFGYDGLGRLSTIAYPQAEGVDPLVVRYEHDSSGNLVTVRDNATGRRTGASTTWTAGAGPRSNRWRAAPRRRTTTTTARRAPRRACSRRRAARRSRTCATPTTRACGSRAAPTGSSPASAAS